MTVRRWTWIAGCLAAFSAGCVGYAVGVEVTDDQPTTLWLCESNEVMFRDGTCKTLEQIHVDAGHIPQAEPATPVPMTEGHDHG
jgi:hypothetical protein